MSSAQQSPATLIDWVFVRDGTILQQARDFQACISLDPLARDVRFPPATPGADGGPETRPRGPAAASAMHGGLDSMEAPVKIEVKVWLPFADSAGRGGRDRGQQQQGQQGLEALDGVAGGGRLCTASLRRALCQLLAHMCRCEPQVRYGVVIAKNAMLMVRRDGAGRVAVSDPTPYTGTNPHPAALVSFAIAKALGHFLVPRDAPMAGPDSAPQPGRP